MSCDEMQGLLAGLIAGDLPPAQEEFVRIHLNDCPRCQGAYASLRRTQAQLESLDADYWPQLTGRINQATLRQRRSRTVLGLLGRGLRAAGALALMTAVLGLVLWQRGPLQQPAAPPRPEPAFLLTEDALLWVPAPGQAVHRLSDAEPGARLLPEGLLWSGRALFRLGPMTQPDMRPEHIGKLPPSSADALLVTSGATSRLIWHEFFPDTQSSRFHVSVVDLTTGSLVPDPNPKEGRVYKAVPSPDGSFLYLLAQAGQNWFVKVIETHGHSLATAHRLTGGFGAGSTMLLSPAGDRLHVVDRGRLLTFDLSRSTIALDREVAGLSAIAALSPAGDQILSARPEGGLALVDLTDGHVERQTEGETYKEIIWKGPWAYGLREGALDLIDPDRLEIKATTSVPAETRQLLVP
jgi:hypothetical protein